MVIFKKIKNIILSPLWSWWHSYYSDFIKRNTEVCIIMGFPRSGTSLISELVYSCGYSFGEQKHLGKKSFLNPHGFFENRNFFNLVYKFLSQSGYSKSYNIRTDLDTSPKGILNKFFRIITRFRLINTLKKFSLNYDRYAVKSTPLIFYFFRQYVPKCKIIGIYRGPITTAHSNTKIFRRGDTFDQTIKYWTQSNKEMIYHLSTRDSILISYEDLVDETKNSKLLKAITNFLGAGDPRDLKRNIDVKLNRSSKEVEKLIKTYPLNSETKEVSSALNDLKV